MDTIFHRGRQPYQPPACRGRCGSRLLFDRTAHSYAPRHPFVGPCRAKGRPKSLPLRSPSGGATWPFTLSADRDSVGTCSSQIPKVGQRGMSTEVPAVVQSCGSARQGSIDRNDGTVNTDEAPGRRRPREVSAPTRAESQHSRWATQQIARTVTLPMAKARGFSAERHDAERLAGCPPELAGVRMDGQHTCEWSVPRLFYPLAACPAERPEHATGCAKCTGPQATPHGVSARAHTGSIARVFEQRKRRGPFTPMPEGRGPLAPEW